MDKRFLLTIVLCFAISVIYMDWITPPREPQIPVSTGVPTQQVTPTPPAQIDRSAVDNTVVIVDPAPVVEEQTFSLSNSVLDIEISNRGAALIRAYLLDYH